MSKLIRNAIVYKAELPGAALLESHLKEKLFAELGKLDWHGAGFVEIPATRELVSTFDGGFAFAVRYDSKILPASIILAEVKKRVEAIEKQEGRRLDKDSRFAVRDLVVDEMLAKALVKTAIVTCYYDTANQFLIVPVSSKQLAGVAVSQLVHAVGSVKTTTINIADVKLGLTTKVREWLADHEGLALPFGERLQPGGSVKLVGEDREKATFDVSALDKARAGIEDALTKGFKVTELGMTFDAKTTVRLTADFHLKGLEFSYEPTEATDQHEEWQCDASIQVLELGRLINAMCDLLGYREPAKEQEAAA